MWRSGAAANGGRKCIRIDHLPPSIFPIVRAKKSHRGLGPPPLSKRQIASRQALPAWNGISTDHLLCRAEGIGRTTVDLRP